jgi:hypothetical protein
MPWSRVGDAGCETVSVRAEPSRRPALDICTAKPVPDPST